MKRNYLQFTFFSLIFIFAFIHSTNTLNKKPTAQKTLQQQEYTKILNQQKLLQQNINSLVTNLQSVEKNISSTLIGSDKVFLLESAIISQRQTVFNLQNQIIPPFSLSKTACLQLTNQQKIDLLDQINSTRKDLLDLQAKILQAPKCDKVDGLKKDSEKQLKLLDSLDNTIRTQCQTKTILTPTIYQTNIYADGWILGDQNIDDLIEQYYQRNIRYHNITNCPLDKPFFNGIECIKCSNDKPVFDILKKQCTTCPQDQQPDSSIRKCSLVPHFTNFSSVNNWAQQGASMPLQRKQFIPCPSDKPFYNGTKCQPCLLPKYWSIKKNACVQCPTQTLFDINDKKCQTPQSWDLTILQEKRWVTNDCNITRIINQRINELKINQTKKYYKYCPSERPYFDGIVCIDCPNQFNIDSRLCVSKPNKTAVYNQNMHCYLDKQTNFQTDPRADNYTSKYPLADSPTPNCRSIRPYYDGNSCVECLYPFQIFNIDTRKCSACDPLQYYNNTLHKCLPREKIYISTNKYNLMAAPNMSLSDYQDQIRKKMNENPQAIIMMCNNTQYSDYKKCIDCKPDEYFNVQFKTCATCDGTLNTATKICQQKTYLYTNLNSGSVKRIVNMTNSVETENFTINKNLTLHKNSKLCPVDTPFLTTKGCSNCTKQSFDYKNSLCVQFKCNDPSFPRYDSVLDKCTQCPVNQKYDSVQKKCLPILYVTNLNAIYFYIEQDNYTKKNLEDQDFLLEKTYSLIPCDASHPYFDGQNCIDCSINRNTSDIANHKPFFNLKTKQCQNCLNYNSTTHKCADQVIPVTPPVTITTCPAGQVFINSTKSCHQLVSNVTALSRTNYIQKGDGTLVNLNSSVLETQRTRKTAICPTADPMYSDVDKKCGKCLQPTPYYNLLSLQCQSCDNYNLETRQCATQLPRFNMNVQDFYGTIFG